LIPVKFENISHSYNHDYVLKNINLDIEADKITVIIGKSGSGKSTLLQMINGLIIPTEGIVKLFGHLLNYEKINEARLKIGYSVQGTNLFPHMTAYENITLPAKLTNKTEIEINSRVEQLMDMVELASSYKSKYPYQLSGGEQQRVGICRAMLLNPPIFLLDEAFGALDPEVKNEIHIEMLKVQKKEPRTIIMVTHDMREAERLADNIVFLEKGEIQQTGTKEEVLNNPINEFVKSFISIY
jgi:osmoprotectant transport system ATP-binding protein